MEVYLALLALACLGAHAFVVALRRRRLRDLGPRPEGRAHTRVLAADDSQLGSRTLRSERLRLTGRPDALVRAGGRQVRVPYTAVLESALLAELRAVRKVLQEGRAPGPEWRGRRCEACGYWAICWGGSSSAPLPPGRCSR